MQYQLLIASEKTTRRKDNEFTIENSNPILLDRTDFEFSDKSPFHFSKVKKLLSVSAGWH